ncbi:MAG: DUF1232 domain-containing protein [Myxococcales bacterium]|nr:DUF1232 domain-containing protein [Myxococcales bacterium]
MAPRKKSASTRKASTKAPKPAAPVATPKATRRALSKTAEPPAASEFAEAYSDESFWAKVKTHGKTAGRAVLDPAARLYYAGIDPATPLWARTTIIGALGYFIAPLDAIPDLTPLVGYTDDLGVLTLAVAVVAAHITPEHKQKARDKLNEWFG